MKVAVCLSGQMRDYNKSFNNFQYKILNKLDCDIFIHTWEDNITDWNNVIKLYNPKKICIEYLNKTYLNSLDIFDNKHKTSRGEFTNINIIGMYYKIYLCNNLKKEYENLLNKKYDCVIRYRPDLILKKEINENELKNLNFIYISTVGANVWLDDTFAFSNSNNMDSYCEVFNNLNELYNINNNSLHPEAILKKNLDKYNLKYKECETKSGTLREDGTVMGHTFHVPFETIS